MIRTVMALPFLAADNERSLASADPVAIVKSGSRGPMQICGLMTATDGQPNAVARELSPAQVGGRRQTGLTLETRHLSRKVGRRAVVDDVSVQVFAGEILAIVGPSGAGKSSFLRLLNRLDEPTSGTILLKSEGYRSIAPQDLRRRVGMVMQTAHLFPGTVSSNIAFGPRQRGEAMTTEQVESLLNRVGLPEFADRDVGYLSGGEDCREPWRMLPKSCLLMSRPLRWMKTLCASSKNSFSASFRNGK
jgi:ABC-type multidrug transport system fused ATPase/permease subunit